MPKIQHNDANRFELLKTMLLAEKPGQDLSADYAKDVAELLYMLVQVGKYEEARQLLSASLQRDPERIKGTQQKTTKSKESEEVNNLYNDVEKCLLDTTLGPNDLSLALSILAFPIHHYDSSQDAKRQDAKRMQKILSILKDPNNSALLDKFTNFVLGPVKKSKDLVFRLLIIKPEEPSNPTVCVNILRKLVAQAIKSKKTDKYETLLLHMKHSLERLADTLNKIPLSANVEECRRCFNELIKGCRILALRTNIENDGIVDHEKHDFAAYYPEILDTHL